MPQRHTVIHRHQFDVAGTVTLKLQRGAQILSIAPARTGREAIDLWTTATEPAEDLEERHIAVIGTGQPIAATPLRYIDTVVMPSGLVWHVFEVRP